MHGSIMICQAEFVALAVLAIAVRGVVVLVVVVVVVVSFCCFFSGFCGKIISWWGYGVGGVWGPTLTRTHPIPRARRRKRAVYDG